MVSKEGPSFVFHPSCEDENLEEKFFFSWVPKINPPRTPARGMRSAFLAFTPACLVSRLRVFSPVSFSSVRITMNHSSLARNPTADPPPPLPNGGKFKVAVCQLAVTADKNRNIAHAREVIETAAEKGAELIVLPEMWNCPYSNASFPIYAETITDGNDPSHVSPSCAMLSELARSKQVTIIGGSIPERSNDRLYNTCCIFGKQGELKAKHRKIHLFDIDIPGKITFKESETLTAGKSLTIVDTDVGRIAVGICYDIRFQELAMLYAARGAHMIVYPGAFNMTTGPAHWELLARARAVDNQLYVIMCSPARDPNSGYVAWGHSTVIGPFGEIVSTTEHEKATIYADIDYSQIEQRRLNMPLEKQRRGDLYQVVDVSQPVLKNHQAKVME